MAKLAKCRVCGKPYKICINCGRSGSGYNWRRVACSPECGDIYLQRIIESRRTEPVEEASQKIEQEEKVETPKSDEQKETVTKKQSPKEDLIERGKSFSTKKIFKADKTKE